MGSDTTSSPGGEGDSLARDRAEAADVFLARVYSKRLLEDDLIAAIAASARVILLERPEVVL
ncbi:MAG: hypothetical protein JKY65_22240 [Planctomycetes bacterium]|nr:hypothetical protein [Planctomycetota bacterium]